MSYKIGFLTTHPIQYQVPWFREMTRMQELDLTVFYCHLPDQQMQGDGFGVPFGWDIPLLDGYRYEVLSNVAKKPSLTEFRGCDTPEIRDRIRAERFDAVIVNGWVVKSCLQTLRACRRLGVPCIVRGEANLLRPRAWWKHLLHRRLVRQYAAALYIGENNRDFYRRHGLTEQQLFPARYCIDNERFAATAADPFKCQQFRERFGIRTDRPCFLFSARFIAKKHPLHLLRAMLLAQTAGAPVQLLMVGDGEMRAECEEFARQNNLAVIFTGFLNQSEIPTAYSATECLVLTSDHDETWGLVVNESMACGRPALVSDQAGCCRDLILDGQTGAAFRFGDVEQLASLLQQYSRQPEELKRMGQGARQRVSDYSPAAAAQGALQAVKYVCSGRRGNVTTVSMAPVGWPGLD